MNLHVCVNGKSKGRWSSTMAPLHWIHLRLIPAWNPHISHASAGKTTALKIVFPLTNSKPQKPNFRWLAALVPSWMVEQRRQTGSGRTSLGKAAHWSARRPNRPFAVHRAFCMMLLRWPEMRVFSHWESLMQRYYLWAIMCRLAAESAGSAASGELDKSKADLTVSQNWWLTSTEKQMLSSRCCPQISHRNAHLMHNWARL